MPRGRIYQPNRNHHRVLGLLRRIREAERRPCGSKSRNKGFHTVFPASHRNGAETAAQEARTAMLPLKTAEGFTKVKPG